jgi:uncharacterized membrane protein YhaH (DUF805 family)/uncharacterized protein YfcZ (UPF0381/DUF406 family)
MGKICPQCQKENPSSANYCMFCRTLLTEDEAISEVDKLQNELAEKEEILRLYRQRLQEFEEEVVKQQKKIAEKEKKLRLYKQRLSELDEKKPKIQPTQEILQKPQNAPQPIFPQQKKRMFQKPFSFKGRIRRLEYWLSWIISYAYTVVSGIMYTYAYDKYLDAVISNKLEVIDNFDEYFTLFLSVRVIYFVLILPPMWWFLLAQGAKRCHDRNNSGWYQIIPFYFLWMLFAKGDSSGNRYGETPKRIKHV